MKHNFKIGDKVYASDWCYGTIIDIDHAQNLIMVEFETSGGGGTASFSPDDVHLEETETIQNKTTFDQICKILSSVEEDMQKYAPCLNSKHMRPELCKQCQFNEVRTKHLGYSCEGFYKAKALIDAGMCIRSDLIDQIFADIDTALASKHTPTHMRGIEYIPEYYESDLSEAIRNIKQKYRGQQ